MASIIQEINLSIVYSWSGIFKFTDKESKKTIPVKIKPTVRRSWAEATAQLHLLSASSQLLEKMQNCQGVRADLMTLCSDKNEGGRAEKAPKKRKESERERKAEAQLGSKNYTALI